MSDISHSPDHIRQEKKRYYDFSSLAIILSFVTMIEVIAIFLPFVKGFILWALVILSLGKFFAVVLIFMHLVYDKMLYTLLFMIGLLLATGTVFALTTLFSADRVDPEALGYLETPSNHAPVDINVIENHDYA